MILRDYQQQAHDRVLCELGLWGRCFPLDVAPHEPTNGDPADSTVANLATSAGKTIIAAKLIESVHSVGGRTIFLADSNELCQQPLDKLRAATGLYAGTEKAEQRVPRGVPIVVASAQTLARRARLEEFIARWGNPDLVIVDEAHRGSDRNKAITDALGGKVLGITATAFRQNMADLSKYYETVCYELGTFDLVAQGYVSPIKVLTLPLEVDLAAVKQSKSFGEMDYDAHGLDEVITPYYEAIAELYLKHAANRHTIAFLPLRSSAARCAEVFRGNGIRAEFVHGEDENRTEKLLHFAAGNTQVLFNSMLLTTGWDCPACDCLLNLRPTRSLGLYRQMVGRIIRTLPGVIDGVTEADERRRLIAASAKPDALILDLLWQFKSLGLADPASLIATNPNDAAGLGEILREPGERDLMGASLEFQRSKEQQIIDALERKRKMAEEMAKRAGRVFTAQAIDAMELAAQLHQPQLIDYAPVMRHEKEPMTDKQKDFLTREGIDLSTVTCKGHAMKLIAMIIERREAGLVSVKSFHALEARGVADPQNVTQEAAKALYGEKLWKLGKYRDQPLSAAPRSYCRWALETLFSKQALQRKYPDEYAHCQAIAGSGVAPRANGNYR